MQSYNLATTTQNFESEIRITRLTYLIRCNQYQKHWVLTVAWNKQEIFVISCDDLAIHDSINDTSEKRDQSKSGGRTKSTKAFGPRLKNAGIHIQQNTCQILWSQWKWQKHEWFFAPLTSARHINSCTRCTQLCKNMEMLTCSVILWSSLLFCYSYYVIWITVCLLESLVH